MLNVQIKDPDPVTETLLYTELKSWAVAELRDLSAHLYLSAFPVMDAEILLQGEGLVCLYRIGDICVAYPNCSYKGIKRREGLSVTICFGSWLQFEAAGSRPTHSEFALVVDARVTLLHGADWMSPFDRVHRPGWPRRDWPGMNGSA